MKTLLVLLPVFLLACNGSMPVSAPACGYDAFQPSPYDHTLDVVSEPFVVREFRGSLLVSETADGTSPPGISPRLDLDARLELHGPNGFAAFVPIADDGKFEFGRLPSGQYCFKLSAVALRTVIARVVIDSGALPEQRIVMRMRFE